MDKIRKRTLLSALIRYLIPCLIVCVVGGIIIESVTVYLQTWFVNATDWDKDPTYHYYMTGKLLYCSRIVLVPLWSALCLCVTAQIFFRREIAPPVDTLMKASDRIRNDELDFKVGCSTDNELGRLCGSFEDMRRNLYDSNYTLWKNLEERKRLSSSGP